MLLFCASCQEPSVDESDTDGNETPVSPIDTIRFKVFVVKNYLVNLGFLYLIFGNHAD